MKYLLPLLTTLFTSCSLFGPVEETNQYSKGVNIFFTDYRNTFEVADFTSNVQYLKNIGVDTIVLVPNLFLTNENSSKIITNAKTIRIQDLDNAVKISKSFKMKVVLKPHLNLLNKLPRYKLDPKNSEVFSEEYLQYISPYLELSVSNGLDLFTIGTELDIIASEAYFNEIIQTVKNDYPSLDLVYSASWDHFISKDLNLNTDTIGVNAYFSLSKTDSPDKSDLYYSWQNYLNLLHEVHLYTGKKIIITEVGYINKTGTSINPGIWEFSGVPSEEIQADCYGALLSQVNNNTFIDGVWFWNWELNGVCCESNIDYTPKGKKAEDVLKKYWY